MSSENISSTLPVGYMLRGYRIERALGRGGFGITYLATEDFTDRKVVIKENYPGGIALRESGKHTVRAVDADNEELYDWALRSFMDEAKVLTTLRHPHIVQVLTAFKELGTAYYVMDYIGGNSLSKMHHGNITEQRLLDILRPILSALNYIHTLPDMLLHRDIKSDNILITPEGTPILIDFGAARAVISNKTQTKIGTVGYAPPEQWASGAMRGPWTDLYALGATCYYLLTGKNPPDCHDRLFAAPGSDLLANRPDLQARFSRALLASIDKAFALRPADRWQSAQEWLAAITPARNTFPIPTSTNSTRVPTIAEPTPPPAPKISKEVAQAELRQKGISAAEYDSKLIEAAKNGEIELVKLLIAAGADVNKATGEYDGIPLSKAARNGHTECVKLLIAAGADVNKATGEYDWTPLYWAALMGHTECVKLLIDAGTDVNKADEDGSTHLSRAALLGHTECVKLLIAAGADVNRANNEGRTPLYCAEKLGRTECAELLRAAGGNTGGIGGFFKRLFS